MWSSDRPGRRALLLASSLTLAGIVLNGCQVRPLYASSTTVQPKLASIAIDPVSDRVGQQVRNHLIFLFDKGGREPASPAYRLSVSTTAQAIGLFYGSSFDNSASAGKEKVTVAYQLTDVATGKVVKKGKHSASADFRQPLQEFTKLRAVRDAQNRAAIAAAEFVEADIAGYLAR